MKHENIKFELCKDRLSGRFSSEFNGEVGSSRNCGASECHSLGALVMAAVATEMSVAGTGSGTGSGSGSASASTSGSGSGSGTGVDAANGAKESAGGEGTSGGSASLASLRQRHRDVCHELNVDDCTANLSWAAYESTLENFSLEVCSLRSINLTQTQNHCTNSPYGALPF